MSQEFGSLAQLAAHLLTREVAMAAALERGLDHALVRIEQTAHDEIGTYQPSIGPFPAWAQLAPATEERKAALGYPAGSPLLAAGDLRESLSHEQHGLEGGVGFTDPVGLYQELGTSKMPARPVLGPAAWRNKALIEKLIGAAAVSGLIGTDELARVGYGYGVGGEGG